MLLERDRRSLCRSNRCAALTIDSMLEPTLLEGASELTVSTLLDEPKQLCVLLRTFANAEHARG